MSEQALAELQATVTQLRTELGASSAATAMPAGPRTDSYRLPKIPPFFKDDPALWFLQVDASCRNANIVKQATKADLVVASLDFEIVACIKDLISNPVGDEQYDRIKERIIAAYSSSAESRLRQLLKGEVLADGKPSQILCRLRNLNDSGCDDAVIKTVFLEHLPAQCRGILAAANITDLQKLAELADQVVEAIGSKTERSVFAVGESNTPPPAGTSIERVVSDLAALNVKVNKLSGAVERLVSRSRSSFRKNRERSGSAKSGSGGAKHDSGLCWKHKKFGDKAHVCADPSVCKYKPAEN